MLDQAVDQDVEGGLMRGVEGDVRPDRGDRGLLRRQHDLVERALAVREARADGKGAGDVGAIAAPLGAGVDQEQVAVVHAPVVLDVVQDGRVAPEATIDGYAGPEAPRRRKV